MKRNVFVGILGMLIVLFSACGTESSGGMVSVEEVMPTVVPADEEESKEDDDTVLDAYREIYKQVIAEKEGDAFIFSLIYLDNDDIPELAVCDRGYDAYSIYTVRDEKALCIVDPREASRPVI